MKKSGPEMRTALEALSDSAKSTGGTKTTGAKNTNEVTGSTEQENTQRGNRTDATTLAFLPIQ